MNQQLYWIIWLNLHYSASLKSAFLIKMNSKIQASFKLKSKIMQCIHTRKYNKFLHASLNYWKYFGREYFSISNCDENGIFVFEGESRWVQWAIMKNFKRYVSSWPHWSNLNASLKSALFVFKMSNFLFLKYCLEYVCTASSILSVFTALTVIIWGERKF